MRKAHNKHLNENWKYSNKIHFKILVHSIIYIWYRIFCNIITILDIVFLRMHSVNIINMFISLLSELMFLETSALTGENVEEAFVQCARKILNKIESGTKIPAPCALISLQKHLNHAAVLIIWLCRRAGPGADGFRNPVWRCSAAAAAFSQTGSSRECAGVWLLTPIPDKLNNQVKVQRVHFLSLLAFKSFKVSEV